MASLGSVKRWDDEADVVVLGFGLSGAVTAMTAHDTDPDADVLIVEKMPEQFAGGNSRASGQSLFPPHNLDLLLTYQRALNEPNPIPDDLLRTWAEEMVAQEPWIERMAAEVGLQYTRNEGNQRRDRLGDGEEQPSLDPGRSRAEFPDYPGSSAVDYLATIQPNPSGVWKAFKAQVDRRPRIRRRFETAAYDFVQDPDSLEVFGVLVRSGGQEMAIRARRAVVICVGGFENNPQMQKDYFGLDRVYTMGTPGNTGDGLKMLQKAGAEMWHLRSFNQTGGFWPAMKFPEFEGAFFRNIRMTSGSWIDVAKDNRRFYNEGIPYGPTHYREYKHGHWMDVPVPYVLPVHMVFDETTRKQDRITLDRDWMGWNHVVLNYRWSQDNSTEIEKGWIVKADTIRDLARKIGRNVDAFEKCITDFNHFAETGHDPEFDRPAETMKPIATPPFYAVEIVPAIVCTTGGGKRNSRSQVIATNGNPIPRLYEAGELGSTLANIYQNGSFLTECMVFGRIAGRNAVAERTRESVGTPA